MDADRHSAIIPIICNWSKTAVRPQMVPFTNVDERKIFCCSMAVQNSCKKLLFLHISGCIINVFFKGFKMEPESAITTHTWQKKIFDLRVIPESNNRKQSVSLVLRRSMQNTRVQNVSIEKIVGTCNYLTRMIESFRGYRLSGLSRTLYFALNLDLVLDTCLYFALHLDWVPVVTI